MKILAISGSLRATSSNTHVLLALARLAPEGVEVSLCRSVAELPHFNPDMEGSADLPAAALALRAELAAADALAISCPEYAHGIPGSFKNALDWLVGVGLERRPVALLNASPIASHGQASLAEIIRTMDGVLLPPEGLAVPLGRRLLDPAAIAADPALAAVLRGGLTALAEACQARAAAAAADS